MKAIIIGSAFVNESSSGEKVTTDYGVVAIKRSNDCIFLQRHGNNTPPHRINHKANIMALKQANAEKIISVNSCGSLYTRLPPGTIVIPHDYIDLYNNQTFFEDEMTFTVPGLDEGLRNELIRTARKNNIEVSDSGIYYQSRGPRFETRAEVKLLSGFADLVGMTMGTEATLARELGIPYANISVVDNYANGIGELSNAEIEKNREMNMQRVRQLIDCIAGEIK